MKNDLAVFEGYHIRRIYDEPTGKWAAIWAGMSGTRGSIYISDAMWWVDDQSARINGEAPGVLAEEARKLGAALIHSLGAAGLKWLPALVRSVRTGWTVILAALVAPMIGPLGIRYYSQAAKIQEAATDRIMEWQPPDANNVMVWLVLALVGVWVFAVVRLTASSGRAWRTFRMDAMLVIAMVLIMTSAAYQQSAEANAAKIAASEK